MRRLHGVDGVRRKPHGVDRNMSRLHGVDRSMRRLHGVERNLRRLHGVENDRRNLRGVWSIGFGMLRSIAPRSVNLLPFGGPGFAKPARHVRK